MKYWLFKIFKILPVWLRWFIAFQVSEKFLVGVTAFVCKENKILLLKNTYQYYWALPGGYIKKSESFEEAIKREIKEETGFKVELDKILYIKSLKDRAVIDILTTCNIIGGDLKIDHKEVSEADFFDLDNLPVENMPKFQLRNIELYKKLRK